MRSAVVLPGLLALAALVIGVVAVRRPLGSIGFGARYVGTRVVGDAFPKTLVSGNSALTLPAPPRRIASLTVTADEILTSIAEPARIAAVTHFADDPTIEAGAGRTPKAAIRIAGVDPERLIALEPDIVFVAHYTLEAAVATLNEASIPVVRFKETRSYADVDANVRLAAAAIGEESRGEAVLRAMHGSLERVAASVKDFTATRVLYYSPVGYTSGTDTLLDEKIRLAGGRNAAAEAGIVGFQDVGLELLSGLDPEVILVPQWNADAAAAVNGVTRTVAFREVSAVKHHRVYALPASALTSESPDGALGVELLAHLLHPEAFAS